MKNYVTGWRQQLKKEVAKVVGAGAPPKTEEQKPAPAPAAPKAEVQRQPAPKQPQVIEAEPVREPRTVRIPQVRMPPMRVPSMPMEWIAFVGFLLIFRISTDATYAAAQEIWTDGSVTWWHCAAAQALISVIERFMFAGHVNGFTITVLVADSLVNAWGLVVDILPNFFSSGLWGLISGWNEGLSSFTYSQQTLTGVMIALLVGAFLAYSGDKLLDIAMRGR